MARLKPKITYYNDIEQGSILWHQIRKNRYTGSNASKLLTTFGKNGYRFEISSFQGNFYTDRGHLLENEAIELYNIIKETKVSHTGFVTNSLYSNAGYSPDGYLPDRTIEVKCFKLKKHLECVKRPTLEILAQCHFGQLIMDKKITDLILYNPQASPDKALVIKTIKYDKDIRENFIKILSE